MSFDVKFENFTYFSSSHFPNVVLKIMGILVYFGNLNDWKSEGISPVFVFGWTAHPHFIGPGGF